MDNVNVGPICTGWSGFAAYCASPAVKKVLACNSLEGDTVDGKVDDRLAPEAVIARLISGTASSIRPNSLRIAEMICFSSKRNSFLSLALELFRCMSSSAFAAAARRCPRDWISQRRDLVRETADSSEVFPRAELRRGSEVVSEDRNAHIHIHQFYHIDCG